MQLARVTPLCVIGAFYSIICNENNNIYKNNDNNKLLTEDDYLSLLITYFDDIKSLKNINNNTNESFLLSNDEDLDDLSSVLVEKSSEDCSS